MTKVACIGECMIELKQAQGDGQGGLFSRGYGGDTLNTAVYLARLRALAGPFPDARFCPTGGIGEANAAAWLAEPHVVAVGGSWLCPAADIRAGNWAGITAMCQQAMKSLKPAPG